MSPWKVDSIILISVRGGARNLYWRPPPPPKKKKEKKEKRKKKKVKPVAMMSVRPTDLGRYIISIILVSMRGGARNLFKLGLEPKRGEVEC